MSTVSILYEWQSHRVLGAFSSLTTNNFWPCTQCISFALTYRRFSTTESPHASDEKIQYCTQVVLVVQTKTMVYESVNASGFGPQKSNTVRVWCNKTILYAGRFDSQKSNVERR